MFSVKLKFLNSDMLQFVSPGRKSSCGGSCRSCHWPETAKTAGLYHMGICPAGRLWLWEVCDLTAEIVRPDMAEPSIAQGFRCDFEIAGIIRRAVAVQAGASAPELRNP